MDVDQLRDFIDSKFKIPVVEGHDKVCSVREAVTRHVRNGMAIHFAGTAGVLGYQLIREFWGKSPNFTLINLGVTGGLLALIHGRLMKKAVTSFAANGYPSPGPNRIVQEAYLSREVEFENWTMHTIPQMLLAGAMGWGFIPTKSILGSSMQQENKESFMVTDDPFNPSEKIGLMKALKPDITFIHGIASDQCGNTIITEPLGSDAYGAWAARSGVIVSVEKVVSTEYIRRYSHLVRIPSYMVLAVCEVPYGAHPGGMICEGMPEFEPYFPDYRFIAETNEASNNNETFSTWIQHWILSCKDHSDYLAKVGKERLLYLKGKADSNAWVSEILGELSTMDFENQPNPIESMVVAGAKVIVEKCIAEGYKTILSGIGLSNLSAWLAAYELKERGCDVDLMAEIGMYGFLPRPSDPFLFSYHNLPTCKIMTNTDTTLGVFTGGSSSRCMGILAAGQVDKYGNANTTKIPGKLYISGSGGANDVASTSRETVTIVSSGRQRLVEKVPYITYPGQKVRTLVTDVGIFEKLGDKEMFTLTAYVPSEASQNVEEAIVKIKERVGWELDITPDLKRLPPPTKEELTLLRLFDPKGYFIEA